MRSLSVLLRLLLLVFPLAVSAQGGKAFLKEGDTFKKAGDLDQARERYTLAIGVDPKLLKAYLGRAEVSMLLGDGAAAASDLRKASELDPAEPAHAVAAAKAFHDLGDHAEAVRLCETALRRDPKRMDALLALARASLAMGDLDRATAAADRALAVKATTDSYYMHGVVRHATGDYRTAEADLEKVIGWNHLYEPAYVALAETQLALHDQYTAHALRMRTLEKAIEKCTRALELNPQSTDALLTRSTAYAHQKEYAKAIDDVSRCIALGRTDRLVYLQRARYYQGYGQHQNAVNDLNRLVMEQADDTEVLLMRAECKEANLDLEGALRDYDLAQRILLNDGQLTADMKRKLDEARVRIDTRLFELNRESDPPSITVMEPMHRGNTAQVSTSLRDVKVSGYVRDKSLLKSITVNGSPASFSASEKDPTFQVVVPFALDENEIVVQAIDVYGNLGSAVLSVQRTEGVAPEIAITLPKPTGTREITLDADKEELFLEGQVTDASLIRLIAVDGLNASYAPDAQDPEFSVKVNVKDRDRITVRAEDQHGNATEVVYTLVRKVEAPAIAVATPGPTGNPTPTPKPSGAGASQQGVTWLVHIENTNYREFPAIPGGTDMARMKKAFSTYNIQRTITKKNLTKDQMERFFNVELRDLARSGKVNTILVWYAGHGKTVGGKAYWIPVDGRKDDVYSFYNYGSLKAQMQNYSEGVNNTVVVSDAAAGDASFYELTR